MTTDEGATKHAKPDNIASHGRGGLTFHMQFQYRGSIQYCSA